MRGVLPALAFAAASCAAALPANYVQIPTGDWGGGACSLRGTAGTLVPNHSSGVALQLFDGPLVTVIWPRGWHGLREDDHIAVVNEQGNVVARTGQYVQIAGTDSRPVPSGAWLMCPGPDSLLGELPPDFVFPTP